MDDQPESTQFRAWLAQTMTDRGFSQADLARAMGVTEAQVSRWRRGQVVPTVHSLQRIADTFGVPRATLDPLAGYPTQQQSPTEDHDPAELLRRAELETYQAIFGQLLASQVPRELWRVYIDGCASLAQALGGTFRAALNQAQSTTAELLTEPEDPPDRPPRGKVGFQP